MQQENKNRRFGGRGYYIALIACVAAVGISGYVFVRTARNSALETVAEVPGITSQDTVAVSETPKPAQTPGRASDLTKDSAGTATAKDGAKDSAKTGNSAAKDGDSSAKARETLEEQDLMEDVYEPTLAETAVAPVVLWPLQGQVTATFSRDTLTYSQTMADWRTHEGLDIAAELGSMVSATQDGTVTAVYEDDYLGNVVVVSHSGDLATLYANLTEPVVAVGDSVLAGENLAQVGGTAMLESAEPAHLHFEVYEGGAPVDPLSYLPG